VAKGIKVKISTQDSVRLCAVQVTYTEGIKKELYERAALNMLNEQLTRVYVPDVGIGWRCNYSLGKRGIMSLHLQTEMNGLVSHKCFYYLLTHNVFQLRKAIMRSLLRRYIGDGRPHRLQ
jgi:hypothetical protein